MRGPSWLGHLNRPWCSGHQGAGGLALPNTLDSFEHAVQRGCQLIETDVQQTADGELILLHDETIATGEKQCSVAELTATALRAIPTYEHVPSLSAFLRLCHDRAIPLLDLKGAGFERVLAAAVWVSGIQRAIVCGGPLESLLAVHRDNEAVATSLTLDRNALRCLAQDKSAITRIPTDLVTVDHRELTEELVCSFHAAGIWVIAWTVDDPSTMRTLASWDVDGITTNRPDLFSWTVHRA
ncbi:MAG: glycerophosphodiester phosphodiesterase [Chloroflexi bacterium]|nr:glycerophosphodiester phosphodiesterase [Chloroflexota bacterium]